MKEIIFYDKKFSEKKNKEYGKSQIFHKLIW